MQIETKKITETKRESIITAADALVKPHIEEAYEIFRTKADIKGFRKGKAPLPLLKKMYGGEIEQEALTDLVNKLFKRAMEENHIESVGPPVLTDMNYTPGEPFKFSVEYETIPEFELKDYKNIKVEKPVTPVRDQDIEREIQQIRELMAKKSETDKVVDRYNILTVDIQELDEKGFPIIGKRSQNLQIPLFGNRYDEEFIKPLTSAEIGKEYLIKYAKNHEDHSHNIHMKVSVKKIEKLELPELTDEVVKSTFGGKFSSIKELKESIRVQMEMTYESEARKSIQNQIMDEIVRMHDFPVPETLIQSIQAEMADQIAKRFPEGNYPPDFDLEKFKSENNTHAVWQAKWEIIGRKLFNEENVKNFDELMERLESYAIIKEKIKQPEKIIT